MKNNWININDGLPQHSKYVLVHVNGSSKYFLAWYNEITKNWYWDGRDGRGYNKSLFDYADEITHWLDIDDPIELNS